MLQNPFGAIIERLNISGELLLAILFLLLFGSFAIYSLILLYHWMRFAARSPVFLISMLVYFGVSGIAFVGLMTLL
jgi:hypothetical protein